MAQQPRIRNSSVDDPLVFGEGLRTGTDGTDILSRSRGVPADPHHDAEGLLAADVEDVWLTFS